MIFQMLKKWAHGRAERKVAPAEGLTPTDVREEVERDTRERELKLLRIETRLRLGG